jgi:hypothetical protein
MATDNFCFYLQNRLIQTSQTGGQWYSDTSPFSIPCKNTTVSINDTTGHMLSVVWLYVTFLIVSLSVVMLNVFMVSVIILTLHPVS